MYRVLPRIKWRPSGWAWFGRSLWPHQSFWFPHQRNRAMEGMGGRYAERSWGEHWYISPLPSLRWGSVWARNKMDGKLRMRKGRVNREKKSAGWRLWKSFAQESNPDRLISSQITFPYSITKYPLDLASTWWQQRQLFIAIGIQHPRWMNTRITVLYEWQ